MFACLFVVHSELPARKTKLKKSFRKIWDEIGEGGANWHPGRIGTPRVSARVAVANLWRWCFYVAHIPTRIPRTYGGQTRLGLKITMTNHFWITWVYFLTTVILYFHRNVASVIEVFKFVNKLECLFNKSRSILLDIFCFLGIPQEKVKRKKKWRRGVNEHRLSWAELAPVPTI